MSDGPQRVHVAGDPVAFDEAERRIVQPCDRCGIILAEYDYDNPPMVACEPGATPEPLAWWGVGEQLERDPGYPDAGVTMKCVVTDAEIVEQGLRLCDRDEVPPDVEVCR